MRPQMSNQLRGLMKTFGLVVPKGTGSVFERNVRMLSFRVRVPGLSHPLISDWQILR